MEKFSLVGDYTDSDEKDSSDSEPTTPIDKDVDKKQTISKVRVPEIKLVKHDDIDKGANERSPNPINFFSLDPESDSNDDEDDKNSKETLMNPFLLNSTTSSSNSKFISENDKLEHHHNPFRNTTTSVGTESVFSIPIRESEKRESDLLQHHVKMSSGFVKENHKGKVNGKKLCWNHQAGKCRFGHKCSFVHDSDLLTLAKTYFSNPDPDKAKDEQSNDGSLPKSLKSNTSTSIDETTETGSSSDDKKRKKNRGGLSNSIIPSKKALKQFYKAKSDELQPRK